MGKLSRELKMGIHNRFDIEVVDVTTGKVKQRAQAFNVVCNSFLSAIVNFRTANSIQIGSGSGTPAATDTALFHYEGYASDASTYSPYDTINRDRQFEGIWTRQIKRTIPNTSYAGKTFTEIGLATSTSGSNIVTHAMLQDMNGNPISIAHTSTDIITVYCTIYLHYEGQESGIQIYCCDNNCYGDSSANVDVSYKNWMLAYFMLSSQGNNSANAGYCREDFYSPTSWSTSGESSWVSRSRTITHTESPYTMTLTFPQVPISEGNINGIKMLAIGLYRSNQYWGSSYAVDAYPSVLVTGGTQALPANTITGESVGIGDGTTTRFKTKTSFPRNATVYVNGIAQNSGVTIKELPSYSVAAGAVGMTNGPFILSRRYPENLKLLKPTARYGSQGDSGYSSWYFWFRPGEVIRVVNSDSGIYSFYYWQSGTHIIEGSNDGITWTTLADLGAENTQMAQSGAHYKYYRNSGTSGCRIKVNAYDGNNIEFATAPAEGDVITIDYTTDCIPKDTDHVLDVTLTFTFGEWQGN